jgi:hypothetical protein
MGNEKSPGTPKAPEDKDLVAIRENTERWSLFLMEGAKSLEQLLLQASMVQESVAIREILLVGQERPSEEDSKNSGCNSPVPGNRVNEIALCDCQCVVAALLRIRSTE